ncbi:MAG: toll/interleukin-1 receptor domain-containing protein [Solobacterium sp.]|nr:toll/interleukin-1 receptor domain-containing protein [Solobacterium sp.]
MKLFFSYGHDENSVIVQRIKEDVMKEKHEVWVDLDRLESGNDWRRKIAEGIVDSEMFFTFASRHALRESGVCRDELSIAVAVKGALIQSVLLEKEVEVPANASFRQYIDMSDWKELYGTKQFEPWYQEKLQEILKVINDPETKKYEEEVRYLKQILRPNLSIAYKNSQTDGLYCGRGWLKELTDAWIKDPTKNNVLLMTGSPGSGKSAFVSHEFIFNAYAGAVIYCEWDNSESNNADAVIRSVIFQLASHYPDYRYLVLDAVKRMEEDGRRIYDCDAGELFRTLFVRPANSLIGGDRNTLLILIDGIDEIERQSRSGARYDWKNELAELIQKFAGGLPAWIRFFITSRNDTKVTRFLKNFDTIDLDAYGQENRNDVDEYIALRLKEKMPADVIRKVQDKCEENFQYAVLLTDGLLAGNIPETDIDSLPVSLTGLYYAYFSRTFEDRRLYHDRCMPVFAAICESREPIPAETIWKACGWDAFEKQEFRAKTSSYFPREDIFKVFHLSLIDWLCSEEAYEFGVEKKKGRELIAEGCRNAYLDDPEQMNRYELLNLMTYLKKTRDPLLKEVLQDTEYGRMLEKYAASAMEEYRFADALTLAQDAAEIFRSALPAYKNNYLNAALIIVNALLRLSNKDQAEKVCREAEKTIAPYGEDDQAAAPLYSRHGKVSSMSNNWQESEEAYRKAEKLMEKDNDVYTLAEVMNDHAMMARSASCYDETDDIYERMNAIIPPAQMKRENPRLYAKIMTGRAFCAQSAGRNELAGQYIAECLDMVKKDPHILPEEELSQMFYQMSFHAYAEGWYEEGLEYIEKALEIRKRLFGEESVEIGAHLNEYGHILIKLGRLEEAEEAFRKSLRIRLGFYGEDNVYTAYSKRNLALLMCERNRAGDAKEAEQLLKEALALFRRHNGEESGTAAMVLQDLAECMILQEDWEAAEAYLEGSEHIYNKSETKLGAGHCRKSRGTIAEKHGRTAEAIRYYREAIELYRESKLRRDHVYITELQERIAALSA